MQIKINKKHKQRLRNRYGLSVLEMLIVLAAIAITLMISIPGSAMLLEKYRVKATYGNLLTGLELAISEAQIRSSTVRVCPSSNGHTCRSDGNWNLGWLVFTDGNDNGTVEDIELIQAFQAPHRQIRIVAKGAVETVASFTTAGLVKTSEAQTGQFNICLRNSDAPPRVVNVLFWTFSRLLSGPSKVMSIP